MAVGHFNPEVALDPNSLLQKGASVTIYLPGTVSLASIYTNRTGSVKANPFTTDAVTGNFDFYAEKGDYDLLCNGTTLRITVNADGVQVLVPAGLIGTGVSAGSAGNSAAINAAINTLNTAGGGDVYLPKPAVAYHLTYDTLLAGTASYAAIILKSNVRLICEPGTRITAPPTGSGGYRVMIAVGNNVVDADNVSVIGLEIDGQQTALSGIEDQMAIAICGGKNIHIEDNHIRNIRGDAVKTGEVSTRATKHVWVRGNYIHDCVGQAVGTSGPVASGMQAENWIIEGNHCHTAISNWSVGGPGAAEAMMFVANSYGFRVTGNVIDGWGSITLADCSDMLIADNFIRPATGGKGGILLAGNTLRVQVLDNDIDVSSVITGNGVGLENGSIAYTTISGNDIKRSAATASVNNAMAGICGTSIAAPTNIKITNNTIYNGATSDGTPDIVLRGGGNWVTISDNICASNTTAIWCNADNAVVTGNECQLGGILLDVSDNAVVTGNLVNSSATSFIYGGTGVALSLNACPGAVVTGNNLTGVTLPVSVAGATTNSLIAGNRIVKGSSGHIIEYAATADGNFFVPNRFVTTPIVVSVTGANSVGVQSVTGSRAGNAALASLLTGLAKAQLIVDNSTA